MKRIIFVCALPVFLFSYSLDELIEMSHKNRAVEASAHLEISKQKSLDSLKSSYLPSLDIGGTYQNVYDETSALSKNSLRGEASFRYTLYDGGKENALYSQLSSNIDASKKNTQALKNQLSLDIAKLYFEYHSLLSDKEATNQEIKQLQAEFQRLQNFLEAGSVTKDEVSKIDSRLKSATVLLYEIDLDVQKVLHSLEYYTSQELSSIAGGSIIKLKNEEEASARADIESLKFDAEALMYEAKSKKSASLPTIYFDNTLSHTEYYFDDKSKDSGFLVETQNIASVNLLWNILDFGTIEKNYEAKYYEYMSKKSTLEYEKHKASVAYRLAKKSLEIAMLKIDSTKATLDAAASTYELVKIRYQNGVIDNVAYLQALSEVVDAKRGYERALYDVEVKKAELIYYSGKDVKEYL